MFDTNIGVKSFMAIWSVLDAMFSFIDNGFRSIFSAIPASAIPFLIAIFCYSVVAIFALIIKRTDVGNKRMALRAFYYIFLVFVFLFALWRLGIVIMIEDKMTIDTISEFFINLIYVLFAMVLFIVFYRKIPWLKKALLIVIWSLFLLLTFIICPMIGESQLTESTLYQVLTISFIFVVPNGILQYQKAKQSEEV